MKRPAIASMRRMRKKSKVAQCRVAPQIKIVTRAGSHKKGTDNYLLCDGRYLAGQTEKTSKKYAENVAKIKQAINSGELEASKVAVKKALHDLVF